MLRNREWRLKVSIEGTEKDCMLWMMLEPMSGLFQWRKSNQRDEVIKAVLASFKEAWQEREYNHHHHCCP